MPTINVEFSVDVKAKAERLWDILADVKSWPEWQGTSYIKPIPTSPLKDGSTFKVELAGLKWDITVTKAERPNKLSWIGQRVGLKGIHDWEFIEEGGKTKAITRERMSGWLLLILYPMAKMQAPKAGKWLTDLKARAEKV